MGLNDHQKSLKGSRILVLGAAYKENVDDMRESPSLVLMDKLQRHGAVVEYSDPHVPEIPHMREHTYSFDQKHTVLTPEVVASFDAVVLSTAHKAFDYPMILKNAKLMVDTRGKYRGYHDNVIKA